MRTIFEQLAVTFKNAEEETKKILLPEKLEFVDRSWKGRLDEGPIIFTNRPPPPKKKNRLVIC